MTCHSPGGAAPDYVLPPSKVLGSVPTGNAVKALVEEVAAVVARDRVVAPEGVDYVVARERVHAPRAELGVRLGVVERPADGGFAIDFGDDIAFF